MPLRIMLFLYLSIGVMGAANAWECSAYHHRYFILCDAGACKAAFGVAEIATSDTCGRRAVVEEIEAQEGIELSEIVTQVQPQAARGLYEFTLQAYGSSRAVSAAAIWRSGGSTDGSIKLERAMADPSPQAVQAKRAFFQAEEGRALRERLLFLAIAWASAMIILLVLLRPMLLAASRFYDWGLGAKIKPWSEPATVQFVIVLAATLGATFFAYRGPFHTYWANGLLVPIAVVALLCEAWIWCKRR